MNVKKHFCVVFLVFSAAFLSALASGEESSVSEGLVITDSMERTVLLERVPQRVVSLAPSITEVVFDLGLGDRLIGRTDYCDYPAEAASVESIGSLMEPNIEKIIELNPDLLIVSTHFDPDNISILENLGIAVAAFYNDQSFEGTYETILQIGRILGVEEKAQQKVESMKQSVQETLDIVAEAETHPRVYYVVGFGSGGDYTAGGDTFIHQLLQMAGGENIAAHVEGWGFSFEKIVEMDPEIIICSQYWGAKEGLETTEGYKDLNAVTKGNLFAFDNNTIDRQGPRMDQGLRTLAEIMHPELF